MSTLEIKVPDIGDFKEVEVIELLVKPGDVVAMDQSLISVESDKASMEIPSPAAGKVRTLRVALGAKVSEGSPLLELEVDDQAPAGAALTKEPPAPSASSRVDPPPESKPVAPAPTPLGQTGELTCQLLVLGSGPGGYAAAFRGADLGLKTVLVERYAQLGGVCLNVGCIPSKALLHVASVVDEARHFADYGVTFDAPRIDLEKLRTHKAKVVGKLTSGLAGMARARKVTVVEGVGSFLDAHHLAVERAGGVQVIHFEKAVIAAGSESIRLPFAPKDARIVDSTGALALPFIPGKMLIIGGGIIGLEMGTVYSTLGARLEVVEMQDGLMPGADRDLVRVWMKMNEKRFDRIMLKTRTVAIEAKPDGVWVTFEGEHAPADAQRYDLVLEAVGRRPNGGALAADKAGVVVGERGFIHVDAQMRTNVPHIFAIGDLVGQPMLAHKATHQGHVAAEAAAGEKSFFDARVIPSVAYTDPEIAWAGITEDEARAQGVTVERALFPWAASGRAIANGRDEGFTKLLFDPVSHRLLGGAIVGSNAGDLISELALAIEMGADAVDIGQTIHPHPTLGETVGLAAELFEGVCTDLPAVRKL